MVTRDSRQPRGTKLVSYPNFVRGPLLDDMRPFFGPCEVLGTHHQAICEILGTTSHLHVEILWSPATLVKSRGTKLVSYLYFPFISNKRQVKRGNCHTLISSGDLCLMTCDLSLVLVRCLAPIIRQFVKFQDMPKNQKNIDAQSVSFRDTPEIKWKHRCIIK